MRLSITKSSYSALLAFVCYFLLFSTIVRLALAGLLLVKGNITSFSCIASFFKGLVFDFGVAIFFSVFYSIYLLFLPRKWNSSMFNRIISYSLVFLMILISMFSFFAEFTFWEEFGSRFNFIAVDYLVYTFEVINNINESYPLPILVSTMLILSFSILFLFNKKGAFFASFSARTPFTSRALATGSIVTLALFYSFFVSNSWADQSSNHYENELSKAGIYSFFSAFKNNELSYEQFYTQLSTRQAFSIIRSDLQQPEATYLNSDNSILRTIANSDAERRPNVIMVTIESFSADFMAHFGNTQHLTPVLDSIANHSVFFTNMYATGTRTVRGMEALSLAVPPTPGNSIVRRPDNGNLTTIGSIFRDKGYQTTFYYGGDGYFDNMDQYFGSNGFNIVDHGRSLKLGDNYKTKRTLILDEDVHFQNAWGVCDEDLYAALLKDADKEYQSGKPFYDFVMTTSNHRPFTYPNGKVDIPSGSGREGAVKYTDYAIGKFLKTARAKPWFKNTVIIFVADHCASSAGKNEIDISKYHIPCLVYNVPDSLNRKIEPMCSQIDLYPTLFHMLHWDYTSNLYGKDVLEPSYQPRIVLGTYQKLAYMKNDSLVILSPQKKIETYLYKKESNEEIPAKLSEGLKNQAIAYYETAYFLFKKGKLKNRKLAHL